MAPPNRRSSYVTWIIVALLAIVVMLFAGLLPLPGQKNNVTPHSQPTLTGTSPTPELPKGPPAAGRGVEPPPGGTPSTSSGAASSTTATDQTFGR